MPSLQATRSSSTFVRWVISHWIAVVVLAATAVGLGIGLRTHRNVLYDDAAITMRYAYRIAHGNGFTYNNHDRTLGASAPLYTLILATGHALGMDLETAAKALGVACYGASFGLVAFIASRIGGPLAGVVSVVFLAGSVDYQIQAASGMESAFAVVLGLAVLACAIDHHDYWAGAFLGLAVFNKLDAGLLVAAVVIGFLVVKRLPPWRIVATSAVVALPWLVFAQIYFGSVIPYSATQKLNTPILHAPLDRGWILDALRADHAIPMVVLAAMTLFAVPYLARSRLRHAVVLSACFAWPLFHGLFFSLVDLGAPSSWYRTALYPALAVGAGVTLGLIVSAATARGATWAVVSLSLVALAAGGVLFAEREQLRGVARAVVHGHREDDYEAFEGTRRQAGAFLARAAQPGDVIETCFGWIAYEAENSPIKETCPLSTRRAVGPPRWYVDVHFPGYGEPIAPTGAQVVRVFRSTVGAGGETYVFRFNH